VVGTGVPNVPARLAHFGTADGVARAGWHGPCGDNGAVFEVPTLIALVVYLIVGWGFARLLALLVDRPASGVATTRSAGRGTRTP